MLRNLKAAYAMAPGMGSKSWTSDNGFHKRTRYPCQQLGKKSVFIPNIRSGGGAGMTLPPAA